MMAMMKLQSRPRRRRHTLNLVTVLVCASLCLCAGLFERPAQTPHAAATIRIVPDGLDASPYLPLQSEPLHRWRPVYPYSVIPGGALSREELARAVDRDPVVARHYAGFGVRNTRLVRTLDEKLVHVSYRMDNRVFWSSKKIRLARGEALLSDGASLSRSRCGNRISVLPVEPTSPDEPPIEALEAPPVLGKPESAWLESRLEVGDPMQRLSDLDHYSLALPVLGSPPAVKEWSPPYIPPMVPMSPAPSIVVPPVSPGTVPNVPEPSTIVLLASGLAAAGLLKVRRRK